MDKLSELQHDIAVVTPNLKELPFESRLRLQMLFYFFGHGGCRENNLLGRHAIYSLKNFLHSIN